MKIISIIEEARNHMLPGYDSIATINHNSVDEARVLNKIIKGFNLNQDVDRTWGKPTWYILQDDSEVFNISDDKKIQWNEIGKAVYRDPEHLIKDLFNNDIIQSNKITQKDIDFILKETQVNPTRNAKKIFSNTNKGLEFTWGYFTTMKLHPNEMKKFEEMSNKLATKKFKKILGSETKDEKNKPPKEIVAFSFGRH